MTEPTGLKKGQVITVAKWLKKMGNITWPGETKQRNPMTMLRKGHLVTALVVGEKDEWDVAAPDAEDNKFSFYKRVKSTDEFTVGVDSIVCYRSSNWNKLTNKNMFIAQLKDEDDEV